jgi:hypothetical protein
MSDTNKTRKSFFDIRSNSCETTTRSNGSKTLYYYSIRPKNLAAITQNFISLILTRFHCKADLEIWHDPIVP